MKFSDQPVRRVVVIDENQKSKAIADGPSPDVRTDPARPGLILSRLWVTDSTPVRTAGVRESVTTLPHTLVPPPGGSTCHAITFPPEGGGARKVKAEAIEAWFDSLGARAAWTGAGDAPHPYMQKTRTLEFALVIEGEITLVLEAEEVKLSAGDTVVQRGTNHAWSNRSGAPCTVVFSTHDAR
ncbi:MAG: cupin 2, conserved barrel domain protein [Betaproteobacteria bacterium]|nr:cupin 2, conserved barrel domain protein [Betaproteobacteria bacterium]